MMTAVLGMAALAAMGQNARDILTLPAPAYDERIAYGPDANQFADLRLPQGAGLHPVVVVIHGGYWRAAYGLEYAGHMSAALTRRGFATWNIEYRRIGQPGGGYPGTLEDAGRAVDQLRQIAAAKKLDLGRVTLLGHSAGGHLALWVAGRERPAVRVGAVVSLAGVSDLGMLYERKLGNGVALELMGCAPADCAGKYRDASPVERLPLSVRVTMVHGDKDDIVPFAMSEAFVRKAGSGARLLRLEGAGHFEMVDPRRAEWKTVEELITKSAH
ncbi:MAG: alpha/beta hydrolase [Bryobacterales bacterium]|nr:alpha/beta hydrolase [Bryobacterales bacterium]